MFWDTVIVCSDFTWKFYRSQVLRNLFHKVKIKLIFLYIFRCHHSIAVHSWLFVVCFCVVFMVLTHLFCCLEEKNRWKNVHSPKGHYHGTFFLFLNKYLNAKNYFSLNRKLSWSHFRLWHIGWKSIVKSQTVSEVLILVHVSLILRYRLNEPQTSLVL